MNKQKARRDFDRFIRNMQTTDFAVSDILDALFDEIYQRDLEIETLRKKIDKLEDSIGR